MTWSAALCLAGSATFVTLASPREAQVDVSTKAVVARATAYVSNYQQQLTSVVADEEYTQEILEQTPLDSRMPRTRRLRSEVFFVFEAVERQWMAIRDTMLVDGIPITGHRSARLAFESLAPGEVRRRFSELNSQWNLGHITRNFNEPTLGLLVLDKEHASRFKFDRQSVARTTDGPLVTLAYRERERPTLIRDLFHGQIFSRGEIVVDAEGAVRRTSFRVAMEDVRVELTTEYAPNEKLGMWVPSVFREQYERGRKGSNRHELITCEALYANYRSFQVSTRIK